MHRPAGLQVMPLEDAVAQTCRTGAQTDLVSKLARALLSLLKPIEEVGESAFEFWGEKWGDMQMFFGEYAALVGRS